MIHTPPNVSTSYIHTYGSERVIIGMDVYPLVSQHVHIHTLDASTYNDNDDMVHIVTNMAVTIINN